MADLRLDDIRISERKGGVTVRSSIGSKYRVKPLNLDAWRAIDAYLEVRTKVTDDQIFISRRGAGI